jgi:hypothetical protein
MARDPARENAVSGLHAPEADWYSVPPVEGLELERALERVPLGAFTLAGIALALLVAGYLYVYLFIFLPRGIMS